MWAAKHLLSAVIFGLLILSPANAARQFVEVIDGDTVRANGTLVRIVGLDTPETRGAKCHAERVLGQMATERLRQLVANGVDLEPVSHRDRYGRLLAVVRTPDGRDVADVLIAERLADPYTGRGRRRDWCVPS